MKKIIEDADVVIEKFGGIRPMSTKTDIPVTTIQGWKKRGKIPASRRGEIMSMAARLDIDLTGSFDFAEAKKAPSVTMEKPVANENGQGGISASRVPRSAEKAEASTSAPVQDFTAIEKNLTQMVEAKMKKFEDRAVTKSTIINLSIIGLVLAALGALVWPQTQKFGSEDERLAALENDFKGLKQEQMMMSDMLPEDLDARLEELKAAALAGAAEAGAVAGEVTGGNTEALEARLAEVEQRLGAMANSSGMAGLMERVNGLMDTEAGAAKVEQVVTNLSARVAALGEGETVDTAVQGLREQSVAAQEVLGDVPQEDLKAAAMLLGMTQMRASLNRDSEPFEADYKLLKAVAGPENAELQAALDRMAPYAASGVLTPAGLKGEFKTLSGDIVVSSLKGEDVSIQEKAKARMNELFQLQKDGEMVTGTDTQAVVAKAQGQLDSGDVKGAIATLKGLEGEAAQTAQPFMTQAQGALAAQEVKAILEQSMNLRALGIGSTQPYNFNKK